MRRTAVAGAALLWVVLAGAATGRAVFGGRFGHVWGGGQAERQLAAATERHRSGQGRSFRARVRKRRRAAEVR